MKNNNYHFSRLLLLPFFIAFFLIANIFPQASHNKKIDPDKETPRKKYLLDYGWKFHLGDAASPKNDFGFGLNELFAKAGESSGPAVPGFNDSTWRTVNLPHDWAVELNFVHVKSNMLMSHGYKPLGRQFPKTSIGWYRKTFSIPNSSTDKRYMLKFDGVFRDCMVWLNGYFLGKHMSGYSQFTYDVTDYVNAGKKNVLVVRVNATEAEGWFYEGAGIYRHVWMLEYSPLHIPLYGTYITTNVSGESKAVINIQTKIFNQSYLKKSCILYSIIEDRNGNEIGSTESSLLDLNTFEKKTVRQKIKLKNPHLWSLNDPYLYRVVQLVKSGNKFVDRRETKIGIRTIHFDKDKGFFLNGKRVELKGTCNHQDHAGVGSALPDGLQYFRIRRLKAFGCNAYRTSHNPPTPELLDACDSLGMLVMDENRYMGDTKEIISQFKTLILRDRNHPSVIVWSLGNEENQIQNNNTGKHIAETFIRIQKKLDPSRLCTYAANNGGTFKGINSIIPVRGFNYYLDAIDKYRKEHPNQILLGSEQASTVCTRGIYANDTVKGYVSDYDLNKPSWGATAEQWWKFFDARKWLTGGFVWTGFDYRGEPTPYKWPCINSHFGIMDVCGFPKNIFYYYKAWWTNKNVLHIFPHWNWKGKEGQPIDVWCYSNCDSVELFLNGKSLGTKIMKHDSHLAWKVNYEQGTLEARGWKQGKILNTKVETTGDPVAIKLTPDRSTIKADGEDVSIVTVTVIDSKGREVPIADNLIHFDLKGSGNIIGVGNGNPSCHEKDKYLNGNYQRKLFSGKCEVIILSDRHPGKIILKATGENLKSGMVNINSIKSKLIPII